MPSTCKTQLPFLNQDATAFNCPLTQPMSSNASKRHSFGHQLEFPQIKSCTTRDLGNINAHNATLVPTCCVGRHHQPPIIPLNEISKMVAVHIELHKLMQPKCPRSWLNTQMKFSCPHIKPPNSYTPYFYWACLGNGATKSCQLQPQLFRV